MLLTSAMRMSPAVLLEAFTVLTRVSRFIPPAASTSKASAYTSTRESPSCVTDPPPALRITLFARSPTALSLINPTSIPALSDAMVMVFKASRVCELSTSVAVICSTAVTTMGPFAVSTSKRTRLVASSISICPMIWLAKVARATFVSNRISLAAVTVRCSANTSISGSPS